MTGHTRPLRLMMERIVQLFTRSIFPNDPGGLTNFVPLPTRPMSRRGRRDDSTLLHDRVTVESPLTRWYRGVVAGQANRRGPGSTNEG